ncbi:hypothetical protein J2T08_004320 [Neorhizobium galegae]|nr:hypothetical protein [Neorhizobium galegae]MBP2557656.1 hypothetical protein [Neorhizobium galegae]MDQ0136384.1 hypothetical protein [Neorhizobium galegae]
MFEMFDREGLSTEEQLAYVREDLKKRLQQRKSRLFLLSPVDSPLPR